MTNVYWRMKNKSKPWSFSNWPAKYFNRGYTATCAGGSSMLVALLAKITVGRCVCACVRACMFTNSMSTKRFRSIGHSGVILSWPATSLRASIRQCVCCMMLSSALDERPWAGAKGCVAVATKPRTTSNSWMLQHGVNFCGCRRFITATLPLSFTPSSSTSSSSSLSFVISLTCNHTTTSSHTQRKASFPNNNNTNLAWVCHFRNQIKSFVYMWKDRAAMRSTKQQESRATGDEQNRT